MKYAIIADIHANLQALEAVLQDMKAQGCTHAACLGDIVGDNANPKECVDLIREMNIPCVKGNQDEYCSSDMPLDGLSSIAEEAVNWTRGQLTKDDQSWLRELPLIRDVDGFTIVHAMLDAPHRWGYVFDKSAAATSFARQTTPLCFFGHTHVPAAFVKDSVVRGGTYSKFKLERDKQYFVNPGAVGQPRDNSPQAEYATYDFDSQIIELRRVDYDLPGAQGAISASGLPKRPQ